MAPFKFNYAVPEQATTFVVGSWICVANGSGGYDSHLDNPKEPEASLAWQSSSIVVNLSEMLLTDLTKKIEEFIFDAISTHTPPTLGADSTRSNILRT